MKYNYRRTKNKIVDDRYTDETSSNTNSVKKTGKILTLCTLINSRSCVTSEMADIADTEEKRYAGVKERAKPEGCVFTWAE